MHQVMDNTTGQRLNMRLLENLAPDKHKGPSATMARRILSGRSRPVEPAGIVGKMQILIIVLILQLIISNIGSLESINLASNSTTNGSGGATEASAPPPTPSPPPLPVASQQSVSGANSQQYSSSRDSEIATLWKELSIFSEKASSLIGNSSSSGSSIGGIGSDNKTVLKRPKNATFTLDTLAIRNPSSNNQANSAEYDDRPPMEVIIANIVIFVIGFSGNSLVILVILKFTRIETVTDIYILNLAFADLMFLFGLIFLTITMYIGHWIFGTLMCKLHMACTSVNQFASSLLLVVMSFDRFLAVCHPIYAQRFRRLKRAKVICLCIWIACLILMIPIFSFARAEATAITDQLTCAIFWPEYKSFNCEIAFTLYSFAIGFAVPLLLIAAFYSCVIRKLRIAASGPINLGSSRRSRSRENTNKRIEHLVIGIICTYTICWLPYWITQLCVSFTTTLENAPIFGFYPLILIATCLTYTNSALNPILYAFLSDNFKRRCSDVFRSILTVKWCHGRPTMDGHSTVATTIYEASEVNNNCQPESRQTVIMNEAVRLVTSPSQLALDILRHADMSAISNNNSDSSAGNTYTNTTTINNNNNNLNSNSNSNNINSTNVNANNININMMNLNSNSNSNSNYNELARVDTVVSRRITPGCGGGGGGRGRGSVDSAPQHCYINQDSYGSDKLIGANESIIDCNCNEMLNVDNYSGDMANSGKGHGGREANDLDGYTTDACNSIGHNNCNSTGAVQSAGNQTRKKSVAFSVGQVAAQGSSVEL